MLGITVNQCFRIRQYFEIVKTVLATMTRYFCAKEIISNYYLLLGRLSFKIFFQGKRPKKPKGKAPEFTQPLKAIGVDEGNPVRLKCRMTGTPEPTAEWFKNGREVTLNRRIKADVIGDMCQLSFTETQTDDTGDYKCVIKNDIGSAATECELTVTKPLAAPEFKLKVKNVDVNEGEQAQFSVKVVGNPKPNIEWFHGTHEVINEGRFAVKSGEVDDHYYLLIDDVAIDDAGTYKCVASNSVGKTTCRGELEVSEKLAPPEFVDELDEGPVNVKEGEEVSLTVKIHGKPPPDVQWYKDELILVKSSNITTLAKGDKFTLLIYSAKPGDSGVYKCAARSKMGTATRAFKVNIEGL